MDTSSTEAPRHPEHHRPEAERDGHRRHQQQQVLPGRLREGDVAARRDEAQDCAKTSTSSVPTTKTGTASARPATTKRPDRRSPPRRTAATACRSDADQELPGRRGPDQLERARQALRDDSPARVAVDQRHTEIAPQQAPHAVEGTAPEPAGPGRAESAAPRRWQDRARPRPAREASRRGRPAPSGSPGTRWSRRSRRGRGRLRSASRSRSWRRSFPQAIDVSSSVIPEAKLSEPGRLWNPSTDFFMA